MNFEANLAYFLGNFVPKSYKISSPSCSRSSGMNANPMAHFMNVANSIDFENWVLKPLSTTNFQIAWPER